MLSWAPQSLAARFFARRRDLPGVELAGLLLDEGAAAGSTARRLRKLRRFGPTPFLTGRRLARLYHRTLVVDRPRPEAFGVPVRRVGDPNLPAGRAALREFDPDLAVSLVNRPLVEETFSLPPLGTINVHLGSVPDYRGGVPLFWELAEGRQAVGFTIHRVDAGLDTGAVLAWGEVPIERRVTLEETLHATLPKLAEAALDGLDRVLIDLAAAQAMETPQPGAAALRTAPTLREYRRVQRLLLDLQ